MRLLFATDRLHVPDDFSGSVQSTHALVRGLLKRGYECEIIASLPTKWRHYFATGVHRLTGRSVVLEWTDMQNGYVVRRGSSWRFAERVARGVKRYSPDVLVLDSIRMLRALQAAGFQPTCPIIAIMHDTTFAKDSPEIPYGQKTWIVANSPYTASIVAKHFGVEPQIVPPVVHLNDYITERQHSTHLTLVSPHPRKGLNLVLDIARKLPDIPVLLVEGWPLGDAERTALLQQIESYPNVRLRRSTADMREIYRETWVLLAPSELETFGRVVVEAQVSGIPVLASDAGALPWVVGAGGLTFRNEQTVADWVREIERLRSVGSFYKDLSDQAKQNALRSDFQPDHVVSRFEEVLAKVKAK